MLSFTPINIGLIVAVAGSLGAFGTTSTHGHEIVNEPISCGIEIQKSGLNTQLEGWVLADKNSNGTYEMKILKSGSGGSSSISQSGGFNVKAGEVHRLGTVLINGSKTQIDAELRLRVNGKRFVCTGETPVADL
jgi:curli production assembly/transport CsgH protein